MFGGGGPALPAADLLPAATPPPPASVPAAPAPTAGAAPATPTPASSAGTRVNALEHGRVLQHVRDDHKPNLASSDVRVLQLIHPSILCEQSGTAEAAASAREHRLLTSPLVPQE